MARTCLAAIAIAGLFACGGSPAQPDAAIDAPPDAPRDAPDAPPDAPPPLSVDEPPECGGDPLVARGGDLALVVSALAIPTLQLSYDLDGNGMPDNKLAAIASLSTDAINAALAGGTLVLPIEIFDRDADPDPCLKLALYRGSCATAGCNLTDAVPDTVVLDPTSIGPGGVPSSRLRAMMTTGPGAIVSQPGFLEIRLPITDSLILTLPITVMRAEGTLAGAGATAALSGFRVGGVMQAFRLDLIDAPLIPEIGAVPGDSELDIIFANLLGPLLALPRLPGMTSCRTADIDVDQDGLEAFCDSDPDDELNRVDTCIDGDGTIIHDGDSGIALCTQAMLDGVPRFKDGISAALVFDAKAATIAP